MLITHYYIQSGTPSQTVDSNDTSNIIEEISTEENGRRNGCEFCTNNEVANPSHSKKRCPLFQQLKSNTTTNSYIRATLDETGQAGNEFHLFALQTICALIRCNCMQHLESISYDNGDIDDIQQTKRDLWIRSCRYDRCPF